MTTASQLYWIYAIVLSFATLLLALLCSEFSVRRRKYSSAQLHSLAKIGIAVSLLVPLAAQWWQLPTLLISSGGSFTGILSQPISTLHMPANVSSPPFSAITFEINWEIMLLCALAIGLISQLWRIGRDWRLIRHCLKHALPLRCVGRVRVLTSDCISVPFAFHSLRTAYVLIPETFCDDSKLFALSIRHELQHHRQRDLQWLYIIQALRALFFWHPGVHFSFHRLSELQELACDEALLGRVDVSVAAYSRCLLKAALSAVKNQRMLIGTAGMTASSSCKKLTRRIEMMLQPQGKYSTFAFGMAAAFMASIITTVAFATEGLLQHRPLTLQEVRETINEQAESEFPIEVNPEILRELNRYVGTESGRQFFRDSLERRELYTEVFAKHLTNKVPAELEAVALVESGFQNLPQNSTPPHAAGLWQIIPQTARAYGLRVDRTIDSRFDITHATDAAARLLAALHLRFQDWRLAILAYNAGEARVQAGIDATRSRNPWILIRRGFAGDPRYLAKVMAAVLLLQNPDWTKGD